MADEEKCRKTAFSTKLFDKLRTIKEGEFPRLFKNKIDDEVKSRLRIPPEQITKFERMKYDYTVFVPKEEAQHGSQSGENEEEEEELCDIDEILAIREALKDQRSSSPCYHERNQTVKLRSPKDFVPKQGVQAEVPWDPTAIGETDLHEYEGEGETKEKYIVDDNTEGVNSVLSDFYIRDLQEMKCLAYDEELFAHHPEKGLVGSWKVSAKVCDGDHRHVSVRFEGLLVDEDTNYAMYSMGDVDKRFEPLTEFRVEQVTSPKDFQSRSLYLHKQHSDWFLNIRENVDNFEIQNTTTLSNSQMLRVLSEGSHILLMRKVILFHYPLNFEEAAGDTDKPVGNICPCMQLTNICSCPIKQHSFSVKTRFNLKMRSICIGGDLCKTNYRFFPSVKVKYNGIDLDVVRVRRRVRTAGKLVQTINYYITTVGQLIAITFNDPYPFDTPIWLQVDLKAALYSNRLISPQRIVPLRERYMNDPILKQFYEDEVERLVMVNKKYFRDHGRIRNMLKTLLQDLLNDKPHRVLTFTQNFYMKGNDEYKKRDWDRKRAHPDEKDAEGTTGEVYWSTEPQIKNSIAQQADTYIYGNPTPNLLIIGTLNGCVKLLLIIAAWMNISKKRIFRHFSKGFRYVWTTHTS